MNYNILENLRGLVVFATVVRHESFSGAAKELGVTTSAISQQIRALENDLGVVLLNRSTRKMGLTETGEAVYHSALQLTKVAEHTLDTVTSIKGEISGSLRILASPAVAKQQIIPALAGFLSQNPELSLSLINQNDGSGVDLIDSRGDLAFVIGPNTDNATAVLNPAVRQILVASPSYVQKHGSPETPEALTRSIVIGNPEKSRETVELTHTVTNERSSLRLGSHISTDNPAVAIELALQGHGIARTNEIEVKEHLQNGALVEVMTSYELPLLSLMAISPSKDQAPAKVRICLDLMCENAKNNLSHATGGQKLLN